MNFLRSLSLALLTVIIGCEPAGSGAEAEFDVRTTGAYTEALTGLAVFAPTRSDEGQVFSVQLQSDRDAPYVLTTFDWGAQARPAPGTYRAVGSLGEAIATPGTVFVHYTRSQESPFFYEAFRAGAGTVTLRTSGPDRLEGTLDVSLSDAGRSLRLEGTFSAIPGR